MKNSRHGDLSADEIELAKTGLATAFYRHLLSLREFAQIIVLENATPPAEIQAIANVQVFSGVGGDGRQALL